jgi:hypothetical protein
MHHIPHMPHGVGGHAARAEERSARGRLAGAQHHGAGSAPPLRGTQREAQPAAARFRARAGGARAAPSAKPRVARAAHVLSERKSPPAPRGRLDHCSSGGAGRGAHGGRNRSCTLRERAARGAKHAATRGTRPQGAGCRGAHASRRASHLNKEEGYAMDEDRGIRLRERAWHTCTRSRLSIARRGGLAQQGMRAHPSTASMRYWSTSLLASTSRAREHVLPLLLPARVNVGDRAS